LYGQIEEHFNDNFDIIENSSNYLEIKEIAHNKLEIRRCYLETNLEWCNDHEDWVNLKSILCVVRDFTHKVTKERSITKQYYLSHSTDVNVAYETARNHWFVETGLHYLLDVSFHEDDLQITNENSLKIINTLEKLALPVLETAKGVFHKLSTTETKKNFDRHPANIINLLSLIL
jgi:predicted transposase YbfD/YdcC